MDWWTENYPWILAGVGALLLVAVRRWLLGRLFGGAFYRLLLVIFTNGVS